MKPARSMSPRVAFAVVVSLLPIPGPAQAADPSQFSVAENRLFIDDHLRGVPGPATLDYVYTKRGSLEDPVDDTARVMVSPSPAGGSPSVKVEYLNGTRKLVLSDIDAANANPVILFFLEHELREMHRLTGGSMNYYRKRIRMALAEDAKIKEVTVSLGPRRIAATEIHIAPYRDDPARSRYEKFAEKIYVFTLSDDVPGKVVELRSELSGPPATSGTPREMVIAETVRFAGKK